MKINKKIAAFTLMEVTIAMLLTSIVIAITYTTYHIVSSSYIDYTRKQEDMATFLVADKLLKKDVLQARRLTKSGNGLKIETAAGLIRYEFTETYILRDQFALRRDTFKMPVKALDFYFENAPCEDEGLVDQLRFDTKLDGSALNLNYKKIYSAQDLFE